MAHLVLVHSPFVGPRLWTPTGAALSRLAHEVTVPDYTAIWSRGTEPWVPAIASAFAAHLGEGGKHEEAVILVGHSGAGPLLPAIAAALRRPVLGLVFVDAGLPYPGRSWSREAPSDLVDSIRAMEVNGLLPRWSEWFPPEGLADLVPDKDLREAFVDELPYVPASYLDEAMLADDWAGSAGYLQLSEGYRSDADAASARGWAVERVPSDHLAPATAPQPVAAAIDRLVRLL